MMQTEKIHALYARFSHDENYGNDSNSVAHQKELLINIVPTCRHYHGNRNPAATEDNY